MSALMLCPHCQNEIGRAQVICDGCGEVLPPPSLMEAPAIDTLGNMGTMGSATHPRYTAAAHDAPELVQKLRQWQQQAASSVRHYDTPNDSPEDDSLPPLSATPFGAAAAPSASPALPAPSTMPAPTNANSPHMPLPPLPPPQAQAPAPASSGLNAFAKLKQQRANHPPDNTLATPPPSDSLPETVAQHAAPITPPSELLPPQPAEPVTPAPAPIPETPDALTEAFPAAAAFASEDNSPPSPRAVIYDEDTDPTTDPNTNPPFFARPPHVMDEVSRDEMAQVWRKQLPVVGLLTLLSITAPIALWLTLKTPFPGWLKRVLIIYNVVQILLGALLVIGLLAMMVLNNGQ